MFCTFGACARSCYQVHFPPPGEPGDVASLILVKEGSWAVHFTLGSDKGDIQVISIMYY